MGTFLKLHFTINRNTGILDNIYNIYCKFGSGDGTSVFGTS